MKSNIEKAKGIILNIYGIPSMQKIGALGCSYEDKYHSNCIITKGLTRCVIIPKNTSFIIKTSWTSDGIAQCENEFTLYKKAESYGVHGYFAKPMGKFCFCGVTFYLFEKAENIGEVYNSTPYNDNLWERWQYSELDQIAPYLKKQYIIEKLADFIERYEINDLHEQNFGYSRSKKHIIITDYAGF